MLRLIFARTSRPAAALALALASAFCYEANAATPPPAAAKAPANKAAANKAANDKAAHDKAASDTAASDKAAGDKAAGDKAAAPKATAEATAPAAVAAPDFFSLAERYGPAVVHVIARSTDDPSAPPEQEAIDDADPFFAFFRRAPKPASDAEAGGPRVMTGAGSGFIVSPDGVVLTTAHIVDNAEQVTVRLTDKREFKAEVVAVDPQSDVAVLQIEGHDLPFVKLAETAKVHAGEPVLSIGSPDSYQNTVTTGILSATSRTLPDGNAFPFLQTDVAVNPDNSGGPIFNRAGEVIGIGVQIYADGGRYQGLTFAIPIDAANQFRAQLQARKAAPAGSATAANAASAGSGGTIRTFGMQVEDVSPGLAAALGLPHAGGALVDAVDPGSPIGKAGIRTGDVIVQVGSKPVDRAATLAAALAAVPPATPASLKVIRNRQPAVAGFSNTAFAAKAADADATAAAAGATAAAGTAGATAAQATEAAQAAEKTDAPVAPAVADPVSKAPPSDVHAVKTVMTDPAAQPAAATAQAQRHAADRLGLIAHALSAEEKRSTGLPLGLMVEASTGPAASAGVRAGDVVLSLDDTLVESQEQAVALEAKATKSMSLLIQRNNARSFVAVKVR
ncbi:trypsin-like peptidase domain-containing protein [Paraburkholderia sp. CNPSo 3272]|uniref:trypsin-like peptidase domain-containing protein n=1 Tax=Paraburkholderia sp. CNPSo 3272 TaxID=2940931 RepID=UPI0020B8DC61|nr:trypsin-like peptidase domain-containing protein [Paraburkholderia sp. CNPSo 3272]MCP3725668.1 trypsin-like peptidase domain-containing protein [Paraburkholderia sp. CNPSo 3272]